MAPRVADLAEQRHELEQQRLLARAAAEVLGHRVDEFLAMRAQRVRSVSSARTRSAWSCGASANARRWRSSRSVRGAEVTSGNLARGGVSPRASFGLYSGRTWAAEGWMEIREKLAILADAAKYDASCASSGSKGRRARDGGIGNTEGMGICHSYTPDGRCVSLLKILLTNWCIYDCALLHQPAVERRAAGAVHARGGRVAHARVLPAQLHRGAVPQLRDHARAGLHDGAARARRAHAAA